MLHPPVVGHCRMWCILLNPACCHAAQPSLKARLILRLPGSAAPRSPTSGRACRTLPTRLEQPSFRRGGLRKQYLEHPRGDPHHALIFADTDTEFDDGTVVVPAGIGREAKEHGLTSVFCECSQREMPRTYHGVECWILRFDSRMHGGSASFCANLRATGRCHDGFRSAAKYRIGIALRLAC